MIDHVAVIESESARFAECIAAGDPTAQVPSCPDWDLAELAWHLTEVQHHWASIAEGLLTDTADVPDLARPSHADVHRLFLETSHRLTTALRNRDADDRCWSWHDEGWNIGWVRRRQAHEALIHRVDAELAIGERTAVDEAVAADGVDELMTNYLGDDVPEWATFTPDGTVVDIAIDGGRQYGLALGRFRGTGPESGTDWDFETVVASEPGGVEVAGSAVGLDLWLWGRGGSRDVRCADSDLAERVRAAIADVTQ